MDGKYLFEAGSTVRVSHNLGNPTEKRAFSNLLWKLAATGQCNIAGLCGCLWFTFVTSIPFNYS